MLVADVYKRGKLAATFERFPDRTQFQYLDEYVEGGGTPIATSLPLSGEPITTAAGSVPPYFAGLLPEGRRMTALRLEIKASADDELTLLLAVGKESVGDVQIVAHGDAPPEVVASPTQAPDISKISFSDYIGPRAPVEFTALAGVQDKYSGRMFAMPVRRKGREFILKLSPPEFPHMVENEHYFLELSRSCGIPTVASEVVTDRDGSPGLLVTRFDREQTDGTYWRCAVEDGCQVLGLWPADKYSPTAELLLVALAQVCRATPVALLNGFRQFVFALLTGNGDQHAKNISVYDANGSWEVAPAYDLPSTIFYGDTTTALSALGKRDNYSRRQLLEFAAAIGLRERAAASVIDDLLEGTRNMIADIDAGALPFDRSQITKPVADLRNRRKLAGG